MRHSLVSLQESICTPTGSEASPEGRGDEEKDFLDRHVKVNSREERK
jgi:hypothetical protein